MPQPGAPIVKRPHRLVVGAHTLYRGDCVEVMESLAPESIDAVVCDPPYGLEFMGKAWDSFGRTETNGFRRSQNPNDVGRDTPFGRASARGPEYKAGRAFQDWCEQWAAAALRVLKPGGYMLAFGGTRTFHRLTCAIEDAGFQIRDCVMWLYLTGFPKNKSCLKPAYEPIILARKPGPKVLPLGVDECRIPLNGDYKSKANGRPSQTGLGDNYNPENANQPDTIGRWPANVLHDGSDEVVALFPNSNGSGSARTLKRGTPREDESWGMADEEGNPRDAGSVSAARFFYCTKASTRERNGSKHPTVKPIALMKWLVQLVARKGEVVLDPFLGSGTTVAACQEVGCVGIGVERELEYFESASTRIRSYLV